MAGRVGSIARRFAVACSRQASATPTESAAEQAEHDDPEFAGVGSEAEGVGQGKRPRRVGQPVDSPPGPGLETPSQQTRHKDGHHEVERDGAQTYPEPVVGGGEGHDEGEPSDVHVRVEDAREHVDGQEHHGDDRGTTVDLLLSETGPVAYLGPTCRQQPEDHGEGEQHQGDDPAGPGGIPQGGGIHERSASGQPPRVSTTPSWRSSRTA